MIPIDALVSLDDVKNQLNLRGDDRFNEELQSYAEQATGIIIEYINDPDETDLYTIGTITAAVHNAILLQSAWMFQHRGDEVDADGIAPGVRSLLKRTRKEAIA